MIKPVSQLSRKRLKVVLTGFFGVLGSIVVIVLIYKGTTSPKAEPKIALASIPPKQTPESTPTPTPTPPSFSKLTGTEVSADATYLRPLAVMIENHPDARPQSGLSEADLVYEAIAEGGITRFMAVFADPRRSVRVGPVRSARTYYVDYATELGAFYAHVGGNMDALDQIDATNIYDLNQFGIGEPVYKRDFSRNVATEHTMYSTTDALWKYATETKKWPSEGSYTSWKLQDAPSAATLPSKQTISVNFSSASFAVRWDYNQSTNSYARSMAGKPHLNAGDNAQIQATAVVLQTVQKASTVTRINEKGWRYTLTGEGKAVIIQNGTKVDATWKKTGTNRTIYYDSNGQEISFSKGKIWVEIIHPDISYSIE